MPYADPEKQRAYNLAYSKKWQAANPEKVKAYREKGKAATAARQLKWQRANREKQAEYTKRWRAKNPDYYKNWYASNPEKMKEYKRRYREKHPEVEKSYRERTKEQQRVYQREWNARNPDKVSAKNARRLARVRGAANVETVDRQRVFTRDRGRCHICGKFVSRKTFTLDHIVPVLHGGDHTEANVKVAHRSCNSRRGAPM